MEKYGACAVCAETDSLTHLIAWFVNDERLTVHTECWIAAYLDERDQHEPAA